MADEFVQCKEAGMSIIDPSRMFVLKILEYSFYSIVDFGCGFGCHVAEFSNAGREATGVDVVFTPDALTEAEAMGYTLVKGSWEQLPDEHYDVGFSHHCLEHARDPISWLHEWGKKIKPGGKLFLAVPAYVEDMVLAGHISIGFNPSQLAYMLAVAGWDCKKAKIENVDGNIFAIVDRPQQMVLHDTHVFGFGEAGYFLPESLVGEVEGVKFTGDPEKVFP